MALYLSDDSVARKSESSNAEGKSAYVYRWTHISTGKWYVGSRTAKGCYPNDGYLCSSREIKPLIKSNPFVALNNLRIWCNTNKNGWSFEPCGEIHG